jgi:hypothetical protein
MTAAVTRNRSSEVGLLVPSPASSLPVIETRLAGVTIYSICINAAIVSILSQSFYNRILSFDECWLLSWLAIGTVIVGHSRPFHGPERNTASHRGTSQLSLVHSQRQLSSHLQSVGGQRR